jgi:hypothetical protein
VAAAADARGCAWRVPCSEIGWYVENECDIKTPRSRGRPLADEADINRIWLRNR